MNPFKEFLKSMMQDMEDRRQDSITAHYGVKDELFYRWVDEMLIDYIKFKDFTKVIDKWFPDLDNEGRVKIMGKLFIQH